MSDFQKEATERLAAERGAGPVEDEAIDQPIEPEEGDLEEGFEEDEEDGLVDTEEDVDPDEEADDGDPSDEDDSEVDPEYKELEEKYKNLEAEFSRVTANRKEIESSLDEAQAQTVQYKHQLEDQFQEAEQLAGYFAGMANQQLQQLQGVNPAQLSQDQFVQYQQAMMQAQSQSQQFSQLTEQVKKHMEEVREKAKVKEAEIARERLKARIPDWSSEKYKALAEVAQEYGFSQKEYFDTTDHRLMLLLNEVQKGRDAAEAVQTRSKKTRKKPPKNRSSRSANRNEKGQYAKAEKAYQEARPGTKGAFARMKAAELAKERNQR